MRDPQGTVSRYLSTHTPAEIALDLAATALTTVGGGAASAMGGQMARGAYAATREARYASYLWRTDRTAWRHYARNARHRLVHDETGAVRLQEWSPRNGLARSQLYEEQTTRVPIDSPTSSTASSSTARRLRPHRRQRPRLRQPHQRTLVENQKHYGLIRRPRQVKPYEPPAPTPPPNGTSQKKHSMFSGEAGGSFPEIELITHHPTRSRESIPQEGHDYGMALHEVAGAW